MSERRTREPGERCYEALLRAYPAAFRGEFGGEMVQLYRDRRRVERAAPLWGQLMLDVVRSAPLLRVEQLRDVVQRRRGGERRRGLGRGINFHGGIMIGMALLTVLVGIFEIVNSSIELRYGWSSGGSTSLLAGSIGLTLGVVLLAAGVMILRNGPAMVPRVRFAAIVSLGAFLAMQFTMPVLSVAATALGVLLSIALLVWLRVRGGGAGEARTA